MGEGTFPEDYLGKLLVGGFVDIDGGYELDILDVIAAIFKPNHYAHVYV